MKTLIALLMFLAPIWIASLTAHLSEWIQQLVPWLDAQSAIVKRTLVALVAFGLMHAAALAGNLTLHTDLTQLLGGNLGAIDPTDVGALMSAALAYFFHQSSKTKTTS